MHAGVPSRTAFAAAAHRATHQVLEHGYFFHDPLAIPILGEDPQELIRRAENNPFARRMRIFIAVRSRFAEDALSAAVECGTRQLVILGAGLDTYAYRGACRERLKIFEVDHPATQAWKQERLRAAAIRASPSLTFTPIDFERDTLADGLANSGFDRTQRTFFTWLGVVPYLTEPAMDTTLQFIAGTQRGAQVVFDYSNPPNTLPPDLRALHDTRAERVAAIGEPWKNYLDTGQLHAKLRTIGFTAVEDLSPRSIALRYFPSHASETGETGGHILRAEVL